MIDLETLIVEAQERSNDTIKNKITFYIPGMFCYNGIVGKYPAVSLTGSNCALQCDHCQGKLLEPMIHAMTPDELKEVCRKLKERGDVGCLLSGGLDAAGSIPWINFIPAIRAIKEETGLTISIHSGVLDRKTAILLKDAGVDQALIDVIGDDKILAQVYNNANVKVKDIVLTMEALKSAGVPIIPHIVAGLHYGEIKSEYNALKIIKDFSPTIVVIVSLMPLPGTPMENVQPPEAKEIARLMATARLELPDTVLALGCARKRGDSEIDVWAVKCGINRIALPSDEAVKLAEDRALEIEWKHTCCSVN